MPKLFRVIIPVADIEKAVRFYENVLSLRGQRVSPGRHYFNCEGTILACYDPQADGDGREAKAIPEPVYLAVDDIATTFRNAREAGAVFSADVIPGVGPLGEIADRPWGERSFYTSDPFGNPLCFVSRGTVLTG